MRGWKRWALVSSVAVVALVVGGPFVYFHFIQGDAPAPLSIDTGTTTSGTGAPTTALTTLDGTWKVASGSRAGYRITETVFGQSGTAVGRTSAITGQFTLAGARVPSASFSVDMTKVSSNKSLRDNQFQTRIMDTAQYPTATFELTTPIALGSVPADGVETAPSATGKLTIHGTTRTVTIALSAKRVGNVIDVGAAVPITFADYGIDNPSGGPASVGNSGTLEFLLVLSKAS
ncbi:MAG TPA: YceI family protein [Acidimicrobiia bacterium]